MLILDLCIVYIRLVALLVILLVQRIYSLYTSTEHEMSATQTQTASTTLTSEKDAAYIPRGPVTATLNFFKDPEDGSKPHNYVEPLPGVPQRNFAETIADVQMNDVRGREGDFHLEKDAFEVFKGVPSKMEYVDWEDDEKVKGVYYPEVVQFLLDHVPGAHKVTLFDHTIRRSNPDAPRAPVTRVHVDQTARSTEWRVKLHNADEADELLKGRYRIINVWRPLNGPVQAHPLGFASAESVDDNDLVPGEHRYPHRTGETAGVRYKPEQKFYYWSGMQNDERLFLKCYDSQDGVGQRVPHSAFIDPRTPEGARGRESIEVRALVYG